jgi:hypothetical protein
MMNAASEHGTAATSIQASTGKHSCCASHAGIVNEEPAGSPVSCPAHSHTGESCFDYGLGLAKATSPAVPIVTDYAPTIAVMSWMEAGPSLVLAQKAITPKEDVGPPGQMREHSRMQARLGAWLI